MRYFTHDTSARDNRKLWKLVKTHGVTGYGIWWALLEEIYKAELNGFQIEANDLWLEHFADELRLADSRVLIRVFDTFSELQLIDPQMWHEHVIYCPAAIERGDAYVHKKAQNAERKRKERERYRAAMDAQNQTFDTLSRVTPCDISNVTREPFDSVSDYEYARSKKVILNSIDHVSHEACEARSLEIKKEPIPVNDSEKESAAPKVKKGSARRRKAASIPKQLADEFEKFWGEYRAFCFDVDVEPGSRKEAVRSWDALMGEGVQLDRLTKGVELYCKAKRHEQAKKGEAIGVPHGCRFLANRKWQDALDWHERKSQVPVAAKAVQTDWRSHPKFEEWAAELAVTNASVFIQIPGTTQIDPVRQEFLGWALDNGLK